MTLKELMDGQSGLLLQSLAIYATHFIRYLAIAGIAYLLFLKFGKARFANRRIQARDPQKKVMLMEFRWSLVTFVVFTLVGLGNIQLYRMGISKLYFSIAEHGTAYFVFTVFAMILFHDAYFYFTHRAMHWGPLYRHVHKIHHLSINPTPWAAFSFHPIEAVIEAGFVPVFSLFLPVHPTAIAIVLLYMTVMNVLGHLGYEFFPKGFTRHRYFQWFNTSTHHNMHHRFNTGNFSLYFNWWDRWLGTNQAKYHEYYDKVTHNDAVAVEAQLGQEGQEKAV